MTRSARTASRRAGRASSRRGTCAPGTDVTATSVPTIRCAVYTRKSTQEGLEQEFNSLDAQRDAAEAYILSQRGAGWELVPTHYDDGGFTGANTERPGLTRLLGDIEDGRVDAVVVYKVDRLSRSLLDFSKLLEFLDEHEVAFVSVTQQFSTATSAGRLMLHILLSFAQFERETIAERTRDKMRAARRKGRWTGGTLLLGYDVHADGGKIIVNEDEAARVRELFSIYIREKSLAATARELNARGWTMKSWTTKKGYLHQGGRFTKANVRGLLTNVGYTGRVRQGDTIYAGMHDAIIDDAVWQKAQEFLAYNARTGGKRARNKHGALLRGLLRCTPCDAPMGHTYTAKGTKRYRYYVCNEASRHGWGSCPSKSIPAAEIERFVVDRIRAIGSDEDLRAATLAEATEQHAATIARLRTNESAHEKEARRLADEVKRLAGTGDAERLADTHERAADVEQRLSEVRARIAATTGDRIDEGDLATALSLFDPVWEALFPKEQARVLRLLVERVGYDGAAGTLAITFRPSGIRALADEIGGGDEEASS